MRTVYSGLVDESFIGQTVTLFGWAHRRRDHGGVIFIDLRDREGIVQVVCDPDRPEVFATADKCRNEFCLKVVGVVRARPEGTKNETLVSGGIEVLCHELEILNPSVTPPFHLDDENLSETTRLTYRVLDLRRGVMQKNLRTRYRAAMAFRKFLDKNGFIDIETPMLTRSTPEGARDYLVPSRVQDGCFFALPQSPQLFKQLLMVAGFDRYYQIVKCFRDEDLRADRQPEFTQVDIETSFLNMDEIRSLMEELIRTVFKEVLDVDLKNPFPVMKWDDAMAQYGSDKPDLRVHLKLVEVTDVVENSTFKVFSGVKSLHNGKVVALRVPGAASMPRSEIDAYTEFVKIYGAKGLAYIKINDLSKGREGLQSPIVKNLSDEELNTIIERTGAQDGDVVFFGADKAKIVWDSLGALRLKIGHSEFGKSHSSRRAGSRSGSSTSRCSNTRKKTSAGWPVTIRSPVRSTAMRTFLSPTQNMPMPRPTTWFSTVGKSAAAPSAFTVKKFRKRSLKPSRSDRKKPVRSSVFCLTPSSSARLRTAASPSVSTASLR